MRFYSNSSVGINSKTDNERHQTKQKQRHCSGEALCTGRSLQFYSSCNFYCICFFFFFCKCFISYIQYRIEAVDYRVQIMPQILTTIIHNLTSFHLHFNLLCMKCMVLFRAFSLVLSKNTFFFYRIKVHGILNIGNIMGRE